jgi:ornithine cyclodeaminase/alanine dehydrogenase-like protein (mu-crystallin family)
MANAPKPDSMMSLGHLLRTGKQNTEGLSVYDSTGLAIEDLALAEYVFTN